MSRIAVLAFCLAFSLLAPACERAETYADVAWKEGYEDGYAKGRSDSAARAQGVSEGEVLASQRAGRTAASGSSWTYYRRPALLSAASGLAFGLIFQYAVLCYCRLTKRLPYVVLSAAVPCFDETGVYRHICKMMDVHRDHEVESERAKLEREREREHVAGMLEMAEEAIRAMRTLDDQLGSRLVELFRQRADELTQRAEELARAGRSDDNDAGS